jgi:hypothetical protein
MVWEPMSHVTLEIRSSEPKRPGHPRGERERERERERLLLILRLLLLKQIFSSILPKNVTYIE